MSKEWTETFKTLPAQLPNLESGHEGSNPGYQGPNRSLPNQRKKTGWSYFNPLKMWKSLLLWDVTVLHTYAASHLADTAESAEAAANKAAANKISKYSTLATTSHFVLIFVETGGHWNPESSEFIAELGKRIAQITREPLETQFLSQRLSISLQRGNEQAFRNTFLAE